MADVLGKLADLLNQATAERSHYYVARCCREAILEIATLRAKVAETLAENAELRKNIRGASTGRARGGHARAAKLSPERRAEIAKKAANTRWQKADAG